LIVALRLCRQATLSVMATLRALTRRARFRYSRLAGMRSSIQRTSRRGRLVKTTGDGGRRRHSLSRRNSKCHAKSIIDIPDDKRIEFRVGIHVGGIIIGDDDIFGDGVKYCCSS
jgi:hypothetical protein